MASSFLAMVRRLERLRRDIGDVAAALDTMRDVRGDGDGLLDAEVLVVQAGDLLGRAAAALLSPPPATEAREEEASLGE